MRCGSESNPWRVLLLLVRRGRVRAADERAPATPRPTPLPRRSAVTTDARPVAPTRAGPTRHQSGSARRRHPHPMTARALPQWAHDRSLRRADRALRQAHRKRHRRSTQPTGDERDRIAAHPAGPRTPRPRACDPGSWTERPKQRSDRTAVGRAPFPRFAGSVARPRRCVRARNRVLCTAVGWRFTTRALDWLPIVIAEQESRIDTVNAASGAVVPCR